MDLEKVFDAAKDNGTILDIDSYPDRLDLKDEQLRRAIQVGAKLGISSDSHTTSHLHYLEFGVAQARRGWATAKDTVNTGSIEQFKTTLKR